MTDVALEVRDLMKSFRLPGGRTLEAVKGISFDVRKGEIFGFLGPNGAGKTTTISMLTTQARPTTGEIRLGGTPVWDDLAGARRRIGVVPQRNNLDRSLTARENLIFHARYFGRSSEESTRSAEEWLQRMQLQSRADDPVTGFSGGMAQRLKIARALMHDPDILFLDEPTTGLDPQSRALLWDEIRRLNHNGTTIFLTTHYMEEPEQLADRVAIISQGEIKGLDTPAALKRLVPGRNIISLELDEVDDDLIAEATTLPGVADVTVEMKTLRLFMSEPSPDIGGIAAWVQSRNRTLIGLNLQTSTLNDAFINLTGKGLEAG